VKVTKDRDFATVIYRHVSDEIVRISMNRPEVRNAQDIQMTYDLDDALETANADDGVKVIILAGEGPHFSAGHDLKTGHRPRELLRDRGTWRGYRAAGAEGAMAIEEEIYLQMCRRWRNIPKPVIAECHGSTISGGLMIAWTADIIIASDDARFRDLVVGWGIPGVEYFAFPWEMHHRKAREMLFTGEWISAEEAHRLGMVNHVVPRAELRPFTEALARKIAEKPMFGLKLAKEAMNQSLDAQGMWTAMQAVFSMHTLAHTHWRETTGFPIYQGENAPPTPGPARP
jgi:enoyl-CoA hydratase